MWGRAVPAVVGLAAGLLWRRRAWTASAEEDLLVVGCGELGSRVAVRWLRQHPNARVVGATRTRSRHDTLRALGVEPLVAAELPSSMDFSHVVVAVPPRLRGAGATNEAAEAYVESVRRAAEHWRGPSGGGSLVYTSSGGVFAAPAISNSDPVRVTENSPTADARSARVRALLGAERAVVSAGGLLVRMAGLYSLERGPHSYWFRTGRVRGDPGGLINLIHYDDAADLVVAALDRGDPGGIYLGCDGKPMSRKEICTAAAKHPNFSDVEFPKFVPQGAAPLRGGRKVYENSWTRAELGWKPSYASFSDFIIKVGQN